MGVLLSVARGDRGTCRLCYGEESVGGGGGTGQLMTCKSWLIPAEDESTTGGISRVLMLS